MARHTRPTNRIIEAADREEELLDQFPEDFDGEDEDYSNEEVDVDTLTAAVNEMSERQRSAVDATRKRGKAPHTQAPAHPGRARQEATSRSTADRARDLDWNPSSDLSAPPPKPDMEQRWIRVRLGEKDDQQNFQRKFRNHWQPVRLQDVPEDFYPPTADFGRFGTVVCIGDLVLCERPAEVGMKRKKYFAQKLARQIASADRRHVDRVQRADHVISGGARQDMKPSVGRGIRNRTPVQDDAGE